MNGVTQNFVVLKLKLGCEGRSGKSEKNAEQCNAVERPAMGRWEDQWMIVAEKRRKCDSISQPSLFGNLAHGAFVEGQNGAEWRWLSMTERLIAPVAKYLVFRISWFLEASNSGFLLFLKWLDRIAICLCCAVTLCKLAVLFPPISKVIFCLYETWEGRDPLQLRSSLVRGPSNWANMITYMGSVGSRKREKNSTALVSPFSAFAVGKNSQTVIVKCSITT